MDFCVDVAMYKLVKEVQSSDKPLENVVFSPFGMCVILNMIANGAKGATLHQLLHYIKLQSVDDLVTQASNLMQLAKSSGSDDDDDNPVICNFNAVLVKENKTLNKNHQGFLEDVYQAKVKYVDFKRKDEAVAEVNAWVEQETKGLINKLYLNGAFDFPYLTLSHANGLYFNGKWENEFLESNSRMEEFYPVGERKRSVDVPFMKDFENFYDYGSFDEYDVVRIPYKISHEYDQNLSSSRRFSMVIILPKARIGLPKLIEKFQESPHLLTSQHLKMKNELITCLSIPRFKLSYNFIPSDDMQELGLTLPFDFNDELDGLIDDNDQAVSLKVSRIIQHIQVECNEKGTEVIACTYDSDDDMGFSLESPPPPKPIIRFIADHPFIFMIKEDVSDNIFFLGAIFNPLDKDKENGVISENDPLDKENEDISDNEESDDSEGYSLFD